jgi:REP element-mobilizing transposase RayT
MVGLEIRNFKTVLTVYCIFCFAFIKSGVCMSQHSYNKIWLHLIWETHSSQKVLSKSARKQISKYLYDYSKEIKIFIKINFVNADHTHSLIDLPTNITVEDCVKLLKGSSSFYIIKNRLINTKFSWGKGYGVFSVSPSQLTKVEAYIANQEEHHRTKSFTEEHNLFIEKYGLKSKVNG